MYSDKVSIVSHIEEDRLLEFQSFINDLTSKRCSIKIEGDVYLLKKGNEYYAP